MVRAIATATLPLVALCAALAGCSGCQPLLDVRNCLAECERPAETPLRPWNDSYAMWPHLAELVDDTPRGDHQHAEWTRNQAEAFWQFMGLPKDARDNQVFFQKGDEVFRVRVLGC